MRPKAKYGIYPILICLMLTQHGCWERRHAYDNIKHGIWCVVVPVEWNYDRRGRRLDPRTYNAIYYSFPIRGNEVKQWIYSGYYDNGFPRHADAIKVSEKRLVAESIRKNDDSVIIKIQGLTIVALLRFLWKAEAGWEEVEFSAVKEYGVSEVLKVAETAC